MKFQRSVWTAVVAVAALSGGEWCGAQSSTPGDGGIAARSASYSVTHTVTLQTKGNLAPEVRLKYSVFASAITNGCTDENSARGEQVIGPGITIVPASAVAPDSKAVAESEASVLTLVAGLVTANITARGAVTADIAGCPPPNLPRGSAYAKAKSRAQLTARGRKLDRKGKIKYEGAWKNSEAVSGNTSRRIVVDPIVARLFDDTTGDVVEYTLMSIYSAVSQGTTSWDGATLANDAAFMSLAITIDSPVTVQQGRLAVTVDYGIVIESEATGVFAGTPLPAQGDPGAFSVPLPPITLDFDLGGDPAHDLTPEFDFAGAGEGAADDNGVDLPGSLITDIGVGFDGGSIAEAGPFDVLGHQADVQSFHVADDFKIGGEKPVLLDAVVWPVYEPGTKPTQAVKAAYVQILSGPPDEGGEPIAGDMETNRLLRTDFNDLYRVTAKNPLDPSNAIKDLVLDLSWAPALKPGTYWLRLAAVGSQGKAVFSPPARWRDFQFDNARQYLVADEIWVEAEGSIPFTVFGAAEGPPPCFADCDLNGVLDIFDFLCYVNRFNNNSPAADCDGDGILAVFDFLCFINHFNSGC